MYFWYKQPGLKSRTPKNLKQLVVFGQKMTEETNYQQYVELACSSNEERAFFSLDPSGVSNFAPGERKIKKKCPLLQQISIPKKFALCITLLLLLSIGSLLLILVKIYI